MPASDTSLPASADASPRPARGATLRVRLTTLAVATVVLLVAGAGATAGVVRHWTRSVEHRRQARIAVQDLGAMRLALIDQETGLRGYLLSGDADDLAPYRRGETDERRSFGALVSYASDPTTQQALDAAGATIDRWRTQAAEPLLRVRQAGGTPDEALLESSRRLFDDVRASLDAAERRLADRLDEASRSTERSERLAVVVLLASFGAVGGVGVTTIVAFRRWVERPLADIAGAARRIGRGERVAIPDCSIAELSDVAGAVDFLQASLSAERDRALRAYEALEQSAVLALQVRAELADESVIAPPGWSLASALRPAEGVVAGDCFDVGLVDATTMYVVMIDVTGHGAVAALHALKAKAQVRAAVKSGLPPGRALAWLAQHQRDDRADEMLTAFVATIDVGTGACRYANAGHPPALVATATSCVELARTGPLMGAFDDASWSTASASVPPGATLLLYTDGVTEACGQGRERFGEERLHQALTETAGAPAGVGVADLLARLDRFRVGALTDDVSIVALRRSEGPVPAGAPGEKGTTSDG